MHAGRCVFATGHQYPTIATRSWPKHGMSMTKAFLSPWYGQCQGTFAVAEITLACRRYSLITAKFVKFSQVPIQRSPNDSHMIPKLPT